MENAPAVIYGLVDPRTSLIRYIGKSIRPAERVTNHMQDKGECHRTHWLRQLRAAGLWPRILVLDVVSDGWQDAERFWIAEGRRRAWPLTNNTSGGDGVPDLPPETRARIVAASRGRTPSAATRAKIGRASAQRRWKPEQREYMRRKMSGRTFTPQWIAKIRVATSKLSVDDVGMIRQRIGYGEKSCDLAREYGVHRTTIQKVKMGTYFMGGKREPCRSEPTVHSPSSPDFAMGPALLSMRRTPGARRTFARRGIVKQATGQRSFPFPN